MREMKDSGIEWIGEIPADWKVIKNKYLLSLLYSGGTPSVSNNDFYCVEGGTPFVSISDMSTVDYVLSTQKRLTDSGLKDKNLKILPIGTILYSIYATVGAVSELKIEAAISQAMLALQVNSKVDKSFYKYNLAAMKDYIFSNANGNTQFNLNAEKVKNFYFVLPNVATQRRIANYLDHKCSQIDAIIARQQEVIEKLKAYKLSVITEAVTKGLNPDVPMKDSGDDFIGVMPEHWNIAKLGMLFDFLGGYAYNSDSYTSESDNQVIRIGNVKSGYMALENNPVYISDEIASATDKFRINPGSILFTMTGTKGKRDYFFTHLVAEEDCKGKKLFLNQRVGCFIPKESIDAGYYNYLLKENRILDAIFVYETGTANQGNLGIESIRRTKVQLPSKDEQVKIREYLDNRCAKIEGLLSRKSEIICRLMAYKKSLIYEVVTGKKEV